MLPNFLVIKSPNIQCTVRNSKAISDGVIEPEHGVIYTVRRYFEYGPLTLIWLEEITNPVNEATGIEWAYDSSSFDVVSEVDNVTRTVYTILAQNV